VIAFPPLPSALPGRPWLAVALLALLLTTTPRSGRGLELCRTPEGIQCKVVVITHDARLYLGSQGNTGKEAPFMQIYFRLQGEAGGRVPVTYNANQEQPDGWLARDQTVEWNSLQMIDFEPQGGRKLAQIFDRSACAEEFGLRGESRCEELGREPSRSGHSQDGYRLLIPVFEREGENYRGGFVRVNTGQRRVTTGPEVPSGPRAAGSHQLGYDLVLAVDATLSMQQWFRPTTEALQTFIKAIQRDMGHGELPTPFRVGLLFYRDRKIARDCDIDFLTRWGSDLTDNIGSVIEALANAKKATCSSDEVPEAVYDGLIRAIEDPKWSDGHFKVILLVGDAPPHPKTRVEKNPLGLTVEDILERSEARNIRFLTFKIGLDQTTEFEALAHAGAARTQGRFRAIEPDPARYQQALLGALEEEWGLLTKANQVYRAGIGGTRLADDPALARSFNIEASDLPIIVANLPPDPTGKVAPPFVEGWVPKNIERQLAVGEYIFMSKTDVQRFANIIETIALAAQDGMSEGSDAFLASLRNSLAQMLKVQPNELFRSGESLESMLQKARVLPFRTALLSFSAAEVNTWKPADYERLNKILTEKTEVLREYIQKPTNLRLFGDKPHVYVPRNLYP